MNYTDPAIFTAMFESPLTNRAEICRTLQRLAVGIAKRMTFRQSADRADAVSEAVAHGIAQLDRFDADRGNAFSFFCRVLDHKLQDWTDAQNRREKRERYRIDPNYI